VAADDRGEPSSRGELRERVIDLTVFDDASVGAVREDPAAAPMWTTGFGAAGVAKPAAGVGPPTPPSAVRAEPGRPAWGGALVSRVAVPVLVALLVVATAVAVVGFRRAAAWRDVALDQVDRGALLEQRMEEAADVVARAEDAAAAAAAQRDAALAARAEAAGQLGTSEQDVAALEQRLAVLANDKARLEDDLAVAGGTQIVVEPDESLVRCVQNIGAWLDRAPQGRDAEPWSRWSEEAATWRATCDQSAVAIP
jgi:hypothetical protein